MEFDDRTRTNVYKGGAAAAVLILLAYLALDSAGSIDATVAYLLLFLMVVALAAVAYAYTRPLRPGEATISPEPEPLAAAEISMADPVVEPPTMSPETPTGTAKPAKRIRCKSCGTIFNFDETKPVQTCPNCGRTGTATKPS